MASLSEVMLGFFSLVKSRKEDGVFQYLSEDIELDDPVMGTFSGMESLRMYCQGLRVWLHKYNTGIEPWRIVLSGEGVAVEYNFFITVGGERLDLPVALAADVFDGLVSAIRIYYSTWPLYGKHIGRKPILPERNDLELPGPVKSYLSLLAGNDAEALVDLFEENGYIREPSGSRYRHEGRKNLTKFYGQALSRGGIPISHCNVIAEPGIAAVEYFFSEWAGVKFSPEAGMAFYEFDKNGKITAARIYDDGNPPF